MWTPTNQTGESQGIRGLENVKPASWATVAAQLRKGLPLINAKLKAMEVISGLGLSKEEFRKFGFQAVEKMAIEPVGMGAKRRRPGTFKLERWRECFKFPLSRSQMNRYLDRDSKLEEELRKTYLELLEMI